MPDSIVVRDLVKTFTRRGQPEARAVDGLTFAVRRGSIFRVTRSERRRKTFYPVEPLPTPLRRLSWANPITWHVDVLRYATIGIGQPSIVWLEAGAFLMFTAAAFGGALWALKRQ